MDLESGTILANRYRISRQLGRGGMGEVFAAENIRTGRPVAVKLLRSDSKQKSSAVARFRREARAAGSINSDHVTQVLDVEEDSEHGIVIVFELLEGESLIDRLKRTGPIGFEELFGIIEQVWIGLADAHKAGVIHRDLKPSNVFLERRPDGYVRVKILDFGISKLPKEMGGETLTEMGQSLGTFSFMPPEQIGKAKTVDHRADIYACGTLIYQALSGQLPYAARNILVMVEMKSKTDARKLSDAVGRATDPRLEDFLSKTLARDPSKRFQTAMEALGVWRELRPQNAPQSKAAPKRTPTPMRGVQLPAPGPSQSNADALAALETTDDTAATIAMPISHLTGGQAFGGNAPRPVDSAAPTRQDVRPTGGPGMAAAAQPTALANLQRTMPISELEAAAQLARNIAAANVAGGGGAYTPSGGMPMQQQQQQNVAQMYRPTPPAGLPLPSVNIDDSTSQPPSQDKTRVYRPTQQSAPPMTGRTPPSGVLRTAPASHTIPIPLKRKRSAIPFVLGAIAFALVGFGIVAAVLQYLRVGHF